MKFNQKGWSLTEVMLALVVISGMAYAAAPLFRKNAEESNAKIMADDFSLFQTAASAHFQSNRDAYIAAMQDGTGAADICKVGVDPATGTGGISTFDPTLHTCAVDGSILRFQQALPTSVRPKNRYGENWVAIFKLDYTTVAPIEPTGGVEMLVLSADLSGTGGSVVKDATGVETTQRVRITVQRQSTGSDIGMMIRALRPLPKTPEELGLPLAIDTFAGSNSGLILVVGPTGAGKTTTIASVLQGINNSRNGHIVTIEDPIEYVIEPNRCIVNQREIGIDVASFHDGVKDALRFVPDVIMIGEIRDAETMLAGVRAAESGHLVIASLHAPSTVQGVRKCLGYLSSPAEQLSFANSLVGILAQQLVIGRSGQKHLVFETLNGRAIEVQRSISNVMTDASGKSLDSLEQKLRSKELISDFCLPMKMCVDSLIAEGKISRDVGGAA